MKTTAIAWVVAAKIALFGGVAGMAPTSAAAQGPGPKGIEIGDLAATSSRC